VATVTTLTARDLSDVLGVLAEAAAADGETPFEQSLIHRLMKVIPADYGGYYEHTSQGRPRFQIESTRVWGEQAVRQWEEAVASVMPHWPLHDEKLYGFETAVRFSDFVNGRQKKRNPWYAEVMRPKSHEYECKLLLPKASGGVRGFFFVREHGRTDFDERDRVVLTVLRSHLAAIRDRWERRRRPAGLTAREAEVLDLLREGLTNREIARRLVISTGTVRTHVEHILGKLDVHNRAAAIARASQLAHT
jgi:DNA-binding CsgD family transcriptional regulator